MSVTTMLVVVLVVESSREKKKKKSVLRLWYKNIWRKFVSQRRRLVNTGLGFFCLVELHIDRVLCTVFEENFNCFIL